MKKWVEDKEWRYNDRFQDVKWTIIHEYEYNKTG